MIRRLLDIATPISQGKSLFLLGPRGVGKTHLVREQLTSMVNTVSFNLLQGELYRKFTTNPELFRKEVEFQIQKLKKVIVFVDEVQRVPALLNEVHYLLEEYKKSVQFLLTG